MNLVDCLDPLTEAIEHMLFVPESARPWVRLEVSADGPFIQFLGSASRPVSYDMPEQPDMDWGVATELLGTPTYSPELARQYFSAKLADERPMVVAANGALILQRVFGLEAETNVRIVKWATNSERN